MPFNKLKEFLDEHHIKYSCINHSPAFTAQEIAQSTHIAGNEMAKPVIVKIDGELKMVVLPATEKINFDKLKELMHAKSIALATEFEFNENFPDCELGAMPPLGSLYGMDVVLSKHLADNKQIAFNAGTHTEVVRLQYNDFEELIKPSVIAMI